MGRSDSEVLLALVVADPVGRSRAAPLASAEPADFLVGVRPGPKELLPVQPCFQRGMSGLMTLGLPSESELVVAGTGTCDGGTGSCTPGKI